MDYRRRSEESSASTILPPRVRIPNTLYSYIVKFVLYLYLHWHIFKKVDLWIDGNILNSQIYFWKSLHPNSNEMKWFSFAISKLFSRWWSSSCSVLFTRIQNCAAFWTTRWRLFVNFLWTGMDAPSILVIWGLIYFCLSSRNGLVRAFICSRVKFRILRFFSRLRCSFLIMLKVNQVRAALTFTNNILPTLHLFYLLSKAQL